jgi:hypothetical protein
VIRRRQLPSVLVLAAAFVAGVAVFALVGRTAGALYGAAAVTLGLIVQQKLARSRAPEDEPETPAERGPRPRLPRTLASRQVPIRLPSRRRAALEAELARVRDELLERETASGELARRLEEQHERTRQLQAAFAERVTQLTTAVETGKAELARFRSELERHKAAVAELTRERDGERARAAELAAQVAGLKASEEAERARLAWSWRAHVEQITALEAALDSVVQPS